ncbi:TonB-dependent receptor [Sphingomonas sp. ZT3P38]|uniref:TonB-dependent receptor n=1 Tax=Parasphingomonas zepuensis TaxID=3096161 RepID=UPI003FA7B0F4
MGYPVNASRGAFRRGIAGASIGALAIGLLLPVGANAREASDGVPPATAIAGEPAPAQQAAPQIDEDVGQDIVVTGFRQSLEKAISLKRESVSAVDAIVAEDIAKFPDQNLAESLQRIPGISIQRDGGEGRAITVRGLGAQFTRVRVNGMETVATSTDGASANRDRAFDFNVFASELFSSLVVHKTAEASLDEGSLGAVVDLNTGNPLGGKRGFSGALSGQASYNDLSDTVGPRVAGLLSWRNDSGTFGASLSAAYSKLDTLELGNNSVRWSQARFDSVNGTPCFYNTDVGAPTIPTTPRPNSGGTYFQNAACDKATLAFHPRIPRYGEIEHRRERLGVTGSIQFAPTDSTKVSIDGLYSRFKEDREEKWAEVLLRSNERSIDVVNPVYDGNNNMISATLNDAWVRTEHYLRKSQTEFYQVGGSWDQDVTDNLRFTLLGGISKSDATIPVETTFVYDDRDAQGYKYDYTNMESPTLTFGTSVTDPSNFQLAEIRDRPSSTVNKFRTAQLRAEWDVTEDFKIKAGGVYRRFSFDTVGFTRDTVVCGNGGKDRVLGTITCSPTSLFGPTAVYGYAATPALSEIVNLGDAGQSAGSTSSWVIPNIDAAAQYTGLYGRTPAVDVSNTRGVVEKVTGGYLQFDAKGELFGLRYALNAGMRYVKTDQTSTGISQSTVNTVLVNTPALVKRSYDDWLPSMNVAVFPLDNVIIRGAIAQVITRPTLGNLTPGGTVDGFNYRVTFGNPLLDPFRATAYDLAVEWYFAPGSIASVAVFKKDVQSFPVPGTNQGTYASTGLPLSIIPPGSPAAVDPERQLWTISQSVNGTGASLKGIELSVQAPFKFLPGFLSNFGAIANATFIRSTAPYTVSGPIVVANTSAGAIGPNVTSTRTGTLFGLSKKAFNGTLYYEDKKFSARGSVSYRGPYVDANSATGNVFEGYASTVNVDASVRYRFTEWLEVSVEGVNLTDEYRYRYTDLDANRNYENNHFGRTILLGARVKM